MAYSADADSDCGKWTSLDKQAIIDLFAPVAPVPFEFEDNLLRGRWWKNVWNLPFSGLSCAMGGITVDKIVNDPGLRRLAYKIIAETIAIANADMLRHGASEGELLGDETGDEMMALSDGMGAYKTSTMLDYHARKPMETKYLFRTAVGAMYHILIVQCILLMKFVPLHRLIVPMTSEFHALIWKLLSK